LSAGSHVRRPAARPHRIADRPPDGRARALAGIQAGRPRRSGGGLRRTADARSTTTSRLLEPAEIVARYPAHRYTLPGLLASRADVLPDKPCLAFEGRTWTYREVVLDSERTAAWLASRGVKAGDRVGVFSYNHASTVSLFVALA